MVHFALPLPAMAGLGPAIQSGIGWGGLPWMGVFDPSAIA
jgi:hypothetical protein